MVWPHALPLPLSLPFFTYFHINTKFDESLCKSALQVSNDWDGLLKLQNVGFVWALPKSLNH